MAGPPADAESDLENPIRTSFFVRYSVSELEATDDAWCGLGAERAEDCAVPSTHAESKQGESISRFGRIRTEERLNDEL